MTATMWNRQDEPFDWALYGVLFAAIACLPLSVYVSGWVPDSDRLFYPAMWGSILAVLLARSAWPTWAGWPVGMVSGLCYSIQYATHVLPRAGLLVQDLFASVGWAYDKLTYGTSSVAQPFGATIVHITTNGGNGLDAARAWLAAVQAGGTSQDVTVLWFLVALAIWLLAWHATFETFRYGRPMVAMLPLGIALVANSAVTYSALGYVQVFIGGMLLILSYANMTRMHGIWQRFGVDFSTELRRDSLIAGAAIVAIALVVAMATPYVTYNRAVYLFWDRFGPTLESWYDGLDRAFAGRDPANEEQSASGREVALGVQPHDVGLGSDASSETIMWVTTSDPAPPSLDDIQRVVGSESVDPRRLVERRYWRQRTYDVYTGRGWDTSARLTVEFPALAEWETPLYAGRTLTQTYTLKAPVGDVAFGVNEPLSVDAPYTAVWRDGHDLVALLVNADSYTVVSNVVQPTEDELRAAEEPYEGAVAGRYLALPEIPQRVRDLAQEVIDSAGATTRYDKARAIEGYLRTFTYDLDVPPPPRGQDTVDYFLFSAQRGFCDYSASAMVVMLRSMGVAARYASGYGMGQYDYILKQWVVTGKNAHAWAEVYFPGIGWIEFEPTPTELPREFAGSSIAYTLPQLPQADVAPVSRPVAWTGLGSLLAVVVVLALALLLISGRIPYRPGPGADPRRVIARIYRALVGLAAWLRVYPENGQTPTEFLEGLGRALERRGSYGGLVANDVRAIGRAYQRARYGPDAAVSAYDRDSAVAAYNRLRKRLFRLVLKRRPRAAF